MGAEFIVLAEPTQMHISAVDKFVTLLREGKLNHLIRNRIELDYEQETNLLDEEREFVPIGRENGQEIILLQGLVAKSEE